MADKKSTNYAKPLHTNTNIGVYHYYHSDHFYSLPNVSYTRKMHGVKRVIIFCIMIVILPATLIIIPLYLRKTVFADVTYRVAESDIIEIRDGISSIFCQQHSLRMSSNFNAFQLRSRPEISSNRKHIRLKKSMTLPDDTLEYWGFYLLKGAKVHLKFCSRYDGSRILVVKGQRELKTCGLLDHNKNKVGANFAQGHEKVRVFFEDITEITELIPGDDLTALLEKKALDAKILGDREAYMELENQGGEDLSEDDITADGAATEPTNQTAAVKDMETVKRVKTTQELSEIVLQTESKETNAPSTIFNSTNSILTSDLEASNSSAAFEVIEQDEITTTTVSPTPKSTKHPRRKHKKGSSETHNKHHKNTNDSLVEITTTPRTGGNSLQTSAERIEDVGNRQRRHHQEQKKLQEQQKLQEQLEYQQEQLKFSNQQKTHKQPKQGKSSPSEQQKLEEQKELTEQQKFEEHQILKEQQEFDEQQKLYEQQHFEDQQEVEEHQHAPKEHKQITSNIIDKKTHNKTNATLISSAEIEDKALLLRRLEELKIKRQQIYDQLYKKRTKREHVYDRKYSHGGNALNFTEADESNSISSFENALYDCYNGDILLAEGFPPSAECLNAHFLENGSHRMLSKHDVTQDGYYYYIFYSDNDLVRNDIHAIFDIYKPTFQYSNLSDAQGCVNATNCTFPIGFLSNEIVVVEVPTRDGIEHEEDDITYLISTCHPRMEIYAIFPITVLLLILSCSFI